MSSSQIVQLFASGVFLLIVLMFLPGGLGSLAYKLRDAFLRRVAIRRRIHVPSLLGGIGLAGGQLAKIPLTPKPGVGGTTARVPTRYRLKSRIGAAGASQAGKRWTY
jgi:hypothetical protein